MVVIGIGVAVGFFTYFKTTDQKLQFNSGDVNSALVAVKKDEPYYAICTADLSDPGYAYSSGEDKCFMLVRVDAKGKKLSFITLPARLQVTFPDEQKRVLADYPSEASLIKAVADYCGVGISHYVSIDSKSIGSLVDLVGGVKVKIEKEIDDPKAGAKVLEPGDVSLDPKSALVFLRATNILGGLSSTANNRVDFTVALASAALNNSGLSFASLVSDASKYVKTDMSSSEINSLGDNLRPIDSLTIFKSIIPFTAVSGKDIDSYVYTPVSSEWTAMLDAFKKGDDPAKAQAQESSISKSNLKVEVRNGSGITGIATELGKKMSELGYQVISVGNVDDATVYPETLVVYMSPENAESARVITKDISEGRTVNGGDYYKSDADIIVIIGTDWGS